MPVGKLVRPHGQTGLHWAAWEAHVDLLRTLLDAGAPVDIRDDTYDGTPLDWAVYAWSGGGPRPGDARYYEVVERLVAAGATVNRAWTGPTDAPTALGTTLRADPRMRAALALDPP
jgi:hypothetical protein